MLFDNQKKYEIDVSQKSATGSPMDISGLVNYLSDHVMKDSRKELFILHGSV
jgi:ubiquitin related modifier 1